MPNENKSRKSLTKSLSPNKRIIHFPKIKKKQCTLGLQS